MTTRVIVAGAFGRTGGAALRAALAADGVEVVGGLVDPAEVGKTDMTLPAGVPAFGTLEEAPDADVLIDFTTPAAVAAIMPTAAERGIGVVTGTTGLGDDQQAGVERAARKIAVVQSGNYSFGVNALMALVRKAASLLEGYDIEINETHHRRKVDAPSGTALMLGEAAAVGSGGALSERAVFERYGQAGPRSDGEIGFSVVRGGGVAGDHTVSFLSEGEVVTLSHRALSRTLFADGAVRAAVWAAAQPAGLYNMADVLGLD